MVSMLQTKGLENNNCKSTCINNKPEALASRNSWGLLFWTNALTILIFHDQWDFSCLEF